MTIQLSKETSHDVMLARASDAAIIAFNVRASPQASELARRDGVDIRYYSVIYNVVDDVKAIMAGLSAPEMIEKALGHADIREVFTIPNRNDITRHDIMRLASMRLCITLAEDADNLAILSENRQAADVLFDH